MKSLKRIASVLLALILVLGTVQAAPLHVSAASATDKGVQEYPSKERVYPGGWNNSAIQVTLTSSDYYLKSVKSNNKNLKAKITQKSSNYRVNYDGTVSENAASGAVGLYAKKQGKYKVTITIGKKSNANFNQTISVTVYAYADYPFKSVKVDNKNIMDGGDNYYFSQKTLKFKATAASGYKIKKIEVGTYKKVERTNDNYDSELTWKTIKNGGKFKLSSVKDSYKSGYSNSFYSYRSIYRYIRSSLAAETIVKVTYTDKYTKQADEQWFYFYYIKL